MSNNLTPCDRCSTTGDCQACYPAGSGQNATGAVCPVCDGSGKCQRCDGKGYY